MTRPDVLKISKWFLTISIPLVLGGAGWMFQVEKRVSVIEAKQEESTDVLKEMREDIREIRKAVISNGR